jgi:hypothetical protein
MTDLSELWVPDVLRWADHLATPQSIIIEATARATTGRCDAASELDVPKTPVLTRPAALLSLEDRVAYQAVVASLIPLIEGALSSRVFSSRVAPKGAYFFKKSTQQWVLWHRSIRKEVQSAGPWVARSDLTAFFEHVDHAILLSELSSSGAPSQSVAVLRDFLGMWSRTPGRGLPQGPNASRALGNFYLAAVDEIMLNNGVNYWRYMDDVMIVATSKASAIAGMRLFERQCRQRGLTLSGHKTELLSGPDAVKAGSAPERDAAQYLMDSRQEREARRALRRILKASMKSDGQVDVGGATFSLWRLAQLVDRTPLGKVLDRLEDLGPVARIGAAYLRLFLSRPEVETGLSAFLTDADRNASPVTESWIYACMVEHPGSLPGPWVTRAHAVTQDRNGLTFHRTLAAGVMSLGKNPADIAWLKRELRREYDPEMLRAYLVALARAGELDRVTAAAARVRTPSLTPTITYLANRSSLPSLVWRGQEVQIK